MNPTQVNNNLFKNLENWNEFEKAETDNTEVIHSTEAKQAIRESWDSFYRLRTDTITETVKQNPLSTSEVRETVTLQENFLKPDLKPIFVIEGVKGSGSSLEEAGLKLDFPALGKEIGRGIFGALGIFKEIFVDTATLFIGKKDKKADKPETDPEKAKTKAEKKVQDQKKKNTIRAFYDRMQTQASDIATIDAVRMETQEKANINITAKIGQESYKGIKDAFGRLTIYAASLFEKAQLDQEKKVKKQEKEMKIASIKSTPDLNLDKVAEGGFLSSTGGQGAG